MPSASHRRSLRARRVTVVSAAAVAAAVGTGSVAGSGNLVNGTAADLVAAYNATASKKIKTSVNWTPALTAGLESSARNLPAELVSTTGAGVLS